MASIYKRGGRANRNGCYYISYYERPGLRRTVRGCRDLEATKALARKLEADTMLRRKGVIDARADQCARAETKPLDEHLRDLHADMIAKGTTSKQANLVRARAVRVIELCHAARISELSPSGVQLAIGSLRNEGLSLQTCNFYLRSIKQLSRWLWRDGRTRED
ncbi:unnamed protein product, partial [marine sediment metagenome]